MTVTLRLLEGTPDDMAALQRALESAPAYAELVTGAPPGPADALSTYTILPPGKTYDDKFVFGVCVDDPVDGVAGEPADAGVRTTMIGCIDAIRGYPDPSSAYVGLLLVAEPAQRRGIGTAAVAALETIARGWTGVARLRLGVLRDNAPAHRFWQHLGFAATGETKPYRYGPIESEVVLYERAL